MVHPEYPADRGGLGHLSDAERAAVLATKEIPAVACCSSPLWLFRIYQDTRVDIAQFTTQLSEALTQSAVAQPARDPPPFQLSPVRDLVCRISPDGTIAQATWQPPWNAAYVPDVAYQLYLRPELRVRNTRKVRAARFGRWPACLGKCASQQRAQSDIVNLECTAQTSVRIDHLREQLAQHNATQLHIWIRAVGGNGEDDRPIHSSPFRFVECV